MCAEAATVKRRRGFVLVLIVDEKQVASDNDSIARVCRDYDVATDAELEGEVIDATIMAIRQLRLRSAFGRVLVRALG